jgi:cell division septation protein DedD
MIGLVMFGAFAATTYVFYQKGIKQGEQRAGIETPYVAADPEPIKIETADADETAPDREVYDVFDGEEPEPVNVIAEGPEEPVDRTVEDAIGALAADVSDEVDDRVASLAEEDASAFGDPSTDSPEPVAATTPTPVSAPSPAPEPATAAASAVISALSGSHVVQVGAFRSNDEAMAQWSRMQSRLGDVIGDKTYDVERADLGERGVYHRLRIGPFATSDAAKSYCSTLKENGQDCLIKGI